MKQPQMQFSFGNSTLNIGKVFFAKMLMTATVALTAMTTLGHVTAPRQSA
jgi:hypothetical protein